MTRRLRKVLITSPEKAGVEKMKLVTGAGARPLVVVLAVMVTIVEMKDAAARIYNSGAATCYTEVDRGLRLHSHRVDKYVSVSSLKDCQRACDLAFFSCMSFSYSDYPTRERENCLLSREDSRTLSLRNQRDFYHDIDFVFYERSSGRNCLGANYGSNYGVNYGSNYGANYGSNYGANYFGYNRGSCYELAKTRERIDRRFIIRGKVLRTRDRRECETECDRETLCLGFNYRFKRQGYEQYRDNCELSTQGASNSHDFTRDEDFDFYAKSRSGRNCYYSGGESGGSGGSWGGGSGGWGGGGLSSGLTDSRNECFRLVVTESALEGRVVRDSFTVADIQECERECARSRRYMCKSFSFRYYRGSMKNKNCFLSDQEHRDLSSYNLVKERESDFYERRLYDRECAVDELEYEDQYPPGEGKAVVTGIRCYRDHCREDRKAGYFFCETDHTGAWDYCCRPRARCGYSEDYPIPWCYVGRVGHNQWRPCNDKGRERDYLHEDPHPEADQNLTTQMPMTTPYIEVVDLNN
nr:uncharacterized protein LOC123771868 isoform X1 [Procambarus clarkii]